MSEDNKVVDLLAYRQQARGLKELLAADTSKLSQKELSALVQSLGKVVDQQTSLLNQMMMDLTLLTHNFAGMQNQFLLVSGQAYVSLELLKSKGVCTPEEIDELWSQIEKKINNTVLESPEDETDASDDVNELD